jgi:hypothetical protein
MWAFEPEAEWREEWALNLGLHTEIYIISGNLEGGDSAERISGLSPHC